MLSDDELARIERGRWHGDDSGAHDYIDVEDGRVLVAEVRALRADMAPRVVSTVEELNSLELGTVILDEGGFARQSDSSTSGEVYWCEPGGEPDGISSTDLVAHIKRLGLYGDFTVLWVPVTPGGNK